MMTTQTRRITHVLFDMDGLLLDTEKLYTVVTEQILGRYGATFDFAIKAKMMGKKATEACKILIDATGIPMTPEQLQTEREVGLNKLFPDCDLMPGAERLVRHLHACGIPIAVATSSHNDSFRLKVEKKHQELFKLFTIIVTGDDPNVKAGKPSPDIFLVAAERLNPPPATHEHVLVFEDAPNGVQAAVAAKMPVVMVPDPRVGPHERQFASEVLQSLDDFVPERWGLPPYDS